MWLLVKLYFGASGARSSEATHQVTFLCLFLELERDRQDMEGKAEGDVDLMTSAETTTSGMEGDSTQASKFFPIASILYNEDLIRSYIRNTWMAP